MPQLPSITKRVSKMVWYIFSIHYTLMLIIVLRFSVNSSDFSVKHRCKKLSLSPAPLCFIFYIIVILTSMEQCFTVFMILRSSLINQQKHKISYKIWYIVDLTTNWHQLVDSAVLPQVERGSCSHQPNPGIIQSTNFTSVHNTHYPIYRSGVEHRYPVSLSVVHSMISNP